MVACVRCGSNTNSDLNYLHDEPICIECNKTCCYNCKHWCSYNQMYEDELEPDNFGNCKITNDMTASQETCKQFKGIK